MTGPVMEQAKILLAVLVAVTVPGCSGLYYQVRPSINITADSWPSVADVGDYDSDYSVTRSDISKADLYVIDDPYFGCPGYTPSNTSQFNTTLPRRGTYFVVMLPYLGLNSRCLEFEKAKTARNRWGAAGLIFRYNRDDPQGGKLRSRPSQSPQLSGITIVTMKLSDARSSPLSNGAGNHPHVTIVAHYHQFQASQTFYFIVFAFCILMLLSCLWFVMSYIKRCHYKIQRRRRRIRTANETRRVVSRLPVKSFKAGKNSEDQTCAVCLEAFHNNEAIRVLPCNVMIQAAAPTTLPHSL